MTPYIRTPHFYETDQMAIVHHSNYIRWFEEARVDYLKQLGFDYMKTTTLGIDFAVLGVHCEYKSMVRFGDTVEIQVQIQSIDPIRLVLRYEAVHQDTRVVCAVGESSHCSYHNIRKRPVSLKKEIPQLYELLLEAKILQQK